MLYSRANSSPGASVFPYSRSSSWPSKVVESHLPYHGSIHTNGAVFPGGDQIPMTGQLKRTEIYSLPSGVTSATSSVWLPSSTSASSSKRCSCTAIFPFSNVRTAFSSEQSPSLMTELVSDWSGMPFFLRRIQYSDCWPSFFHGHRNAGCAPMEKRRSLLSVFFTIQRTWSLSFSSRYWISRQKWNG